MRVVLLTNMLPPYRVPFFQELGHKVELHVLVDVLSESDRQWQVSTENLSFSLTELKNRSLRIRRKGKTHSEYRTLHLADQVLPALRKLRPDVVISGELGLRTAMASLYAKQHRVPHVVWYEGTLHTEGNVGKLKKMVRQMLVKRVSRFWANGVETRELLESYRVNPSLIDEGMTGVDTFDLQRQVENYLPKRAELRQELGLQGCTLLFASRISRLKGVPQYLAALSSLLEQGLDPHSFSLLFAGNGECEPDIRHWKKKHPQVACKELGFVQPSELPQFFAAADAFVLPTLDDNWPLAGLEACVAGLPQLFSIYNGGSAELYEQDVTGVCVDPLDSSALQQGLSQLLVLAKQRVSVEKVSQIVEYYSPKSMADRALQSFQEL